METAGFLGLIFAGIIGIITGLKKFNFKKIKINCLSGCCECEN